MYVCLYIIGIFAFTPFLPDLIGYASARWTGPGVSTFVLWTELLLGFLFICVGLFLLKTNKRNALFYLISVLGIILLSIILYKFLPNPYEFTHFPEYAVLSFLLMKALNKKKGSQKEPQMRRKIIHNPYFLSGMITGLVGITDEVYQHFIPQRHFLWYDIFLNLTGGILGLLIYWGLSKKDGPNHGSGANKGK